ncbi:MAG: hypothetical protein ACTHMQ_04195 [Protaetiibacter sp.]
MPNYIVNSNAQSNGDHEVHNRDNPCSFMPLSINQVSLGWHAECSSAVREANSRGYSPANGCAYCVPLCNTR